ncbi:ATP-binding protein [Acanthopleuribacter pedis]|uniref:histidine kinase n=1 Tax=Acanthopleuribacter pedis TaxID=442870 RepID=A0A8J7U197_9BACT|nr:ATP-binding protein [Acanthopleuribacter pedis]MBO1317297.1 response regulator [Acanthopleuribacter pedis]MBO1318604.1 response regulator [Acanthopleuribacter pedis]
MPWAQVSAGPPLFSTRYSTEEGLLNYQVNCLFQDDDGYLWIGTNNGLNRFDGHAFWKIQPDVAGEAVNPYIYIRAIDADSEGNLWLAASEGLYRFNKNRDHLTKVKAPRTATESGFRNLLVDHQDRVWATDTLGRLWRYTPTTENLVNLSDTIPNPTPEEAIRCTALTDLGNKLWLGTQKGLFRWDAGHDRPVPVKNTRNAATPAFGSAVQILARDPEGRPWVVGDQGVASFSMALGEFLPRFLFEQDTQAQPPYHALAVVDASTLWLAGRDHLLHVTLRGTPTATRYSYGAIHALTDDRIRTMLVDEAGTLWIGSLFGGLNRITRANTIESLPLTRPAGVRSQYPSVRAVAFADNDVLWVGDYDGLFSLQNGTTLQHQGDAGEVPEKMRIEALLPTRRNQLLIGGTPGLYQRASASDMENPGFTPWRAGATTPFGAMSVLSLHQSSSETIWVGTAQNGLFKIDEARNKVTPVTVAGTPLQKILGKILCLTQDANKALWLGTNRGLYEWTARGKLQPHLLPVDGPLDSRQIRINSLFAQKGNQSLWVATNEDGVFFRNAGNKDFQQLSHKNGLPGNKALSLMEDRLNNMWISTVAGITKYDPFSRELTNYPFNDGSRALRFVGNTMARDGSGAMVVAGTNGLYRFHPGAFRGELPLLQPRFTSLTLFQEGNLREVIPVPTVTESDGLPTLRLPYQSSHFKLRVSARKIADPKLVRYEYQLGDEGNPWQPINHPLPVIQFTHQEPGSYLLRVRAHHAGNRTSRKPTQLRVVIVAPFHRSTPALLLYASLLLAAMGTYVFFQRRTTLRHRRMTERLRHLDQTKDRIMHNIGHELKTPLQSMIGIAQALVGGRRGNLSPEARNDLRVLIDSGEGLAATVGDIMDLANLNKKELRFHITTVNLKQVVDVVVALSKPFIGDKPLKLSNSIPEHYFVKADINRTKQILFNLVDNAIKYSKNGVVSLSAKENGNLTTIKVTDQGRGIEPHQIDHIFEHFERADFNMVGSLGGAGLGLAITKTLVERHGGDIYVQSTPGEGSSFYFTLPRAVPEEDPASEASIFGAVTLNDDTGYPVHDHGRKGFKILTVDDNPINLQLLVNILSAQDYQIQQAQNGFDALEILKNEPEIDLVLLDIAMPRLSGYDVCLNIRERHGPSQLPVMFLSAMHQTSDIARCFEVGGNDYLAKPVTKVELLARVKTQLDLLDAHRNLEAKVAARTREVEFLAEVGRELTAKLDFTEVAQRLYHQLTPLMDTYGYGIGIHEPDSAMIHFKHLMRNNSPIPDFSLEVANGERLPALCIRTGQTIHINNLDDEFHRYVENPNAAEFYDGIKSYLAIPMIDHAVEGALAKGVILLFSPEPYAYEESQLSVLRSLAGSTSIALENHLAFNAIRKQEEEIRRTQSQLVQNEKMAGLGTLAAGIAHEINNPANFVNAGTFNLRGTLEAFQKFLFDLMEDEADEQLEALFLEKFDKMKGQLSTIQNGVSRIHGIVKDLRTFSRLDEAEMKTVNIHEGLLSTLHLVRTQHKDKVTFDMGFEGALYCECWAAELNQVFMNILINGCQAIYARDDQTSEPGRISITTKTVGDLVWIVFEDNGCGMDKALRERIFEPFFTTKQNHGTGLGLSISYGIIHKHNGTIEVQSAQGVGSSFTLKIPLSQAVHQDEKSPKHPLSQKA